MGIPGRKWPTLDLPFHVSYKKQTAKCFLKNIRKLFYSFSIYWFRTRACELTPPTPHFWITVLQHNKLDKLDELINSRN